MKVFLIEHFEEEFTPEMEYLAFDWDDNIMIMPTQIILRDDENKEVGMSTEDFATYRERVGKEPFKYKNKTIVGFADDAFRNFGIKGDKQFLIDSMLAKPGPAWSDFVKTINGGSIFSIITARGHSPLIIRRAIEKMIKGNFKGI